VPKKKWALRVSLVLVIIIGSIWVIGLTGWGNSVLFPVSEVTKEVMVPVSKQINSFVSGIQDILGYFRDNKLLREENEQTKKELTVLQEKLFQLQELELENARLQELLNYKEERDANYELVLARVIGRGPSNWYQSIIIDIGRNHGLQINMPVVNHQGLVGTIINVTDNSAEVLLILNGEGAVGARILENRVPGVVIGDGRSGTLQMVHLPHDADVRAEQTVVTSGLGVLYPKGIRIGTVVDVQPEPNGLSKSATIKPFVDFEKLEEVLVIKQVKAAEEDYLPEEVILGDSAVPDTNKEARRP